jgi:hypothetical protein
MLICDTLKPFMLAQKLL